MEYSPSLPFRRYL